MATYSLSGSGTQALSGSVTALHVTITTLPGISGQGRANPPNNFDVGLLRFGDGTGYFSPVAVTGGPQWLAVPSGTTTIGYALLHGAVISVVEVIGGTPPFGGTGSTSPGDLTLLARTELGSAAASISIDLSTSQSARNLIIQVSSRLTSGWPYTIALNIGFNSGGTTQQMAQTIQTNDSHSMCFARCVVQDYAKTDRYKTFNSQSVNNTGGSGIYPNTYAGGYASLTAITSVQIAPASSTLDAKTTVSVYGEN